jgi:hypothetical protein
MPASKADQAEVAARRIELIKLRRAGAPFDDPRILALGYASRGAASKDLIRALKRRRNQEDAEVSIYRQQENERLDALLEAVWPRATNPVYQPEPTEDDPDPEPKFDSKAVDTVLKIMERRAKLNGYDMPARVEASGPNGGPLMLTPATAADLHRLIGLAGDPDPGEDDQDQDDAAEDGLAYEDEDEDADGDGA